MNVFNVTLKSGSAIETLIANPANHVEVFGNFIAAPISETDVVKDQIVFLLSIDIFQFIAVRLVEMVSENKLA